MHALMSGPANALAVMRWLPGARKHKRADGESGQFQEQARVLVSSGDGGGFADTAVLALRGADTGALAEGAALALRGADTVRGLDQALLGVSSGQDGGFAEQALLGVTGTDSGMLAETSAGIVPRFIVPPPGRQWCAVCAWRLATGRPATLELAVTQVDGMAVCWSHMAEVATGVFL